MNEVQDVVKEDGRLKTKDLIFAGAFGAIYLVMMLAIVMGTGSIPILYLLSPLTVGVIGGTIYMLCVLKIHKFGAALILGILFLLISSTSNWLSIATAAAAAVLAELILFLGRYKSRKMYLASFPFFNLNMAAPFALLQVNKQQFIDLSRAYYGEERANALDAMTPGWIWYGLLALAFAGGIIGSIIASRLIKKHFEKAGIV
ncbi:MAG: MptD family putative ECF transporter S component [Lachnospiraceae bacterium]|nr:MptD family putative ECF transporter S component [Lachnospiraceae bacterium]